MNRVFGIGIGLLLLIILAGCAAPAGNEGNNPLDTPPIENPDLGDPTPEPGNVVDVSLQNFSFSPGTIEVSVGDTIRFTNKDGMSHDIFIHQGTAEYFTDSQTTAGEVVNVTMMQAGTFTLDCIRHSPNMTGTIIVK